MLIKVTEDHIKAGVQNNACECPVALALALGGLKDLYELIEVQGLFVYLWDSADRPEHVTVPLPRIAQDFVRDFDSSKDVSPFEFEFDVPE